MTSEVSDVPPEVAEIEAAAERRTTASPSGEIVWRIWGRGPVVVLMHGNFGSWTHWIRNIQPLASRYRVVVPDIPGFGNSADAPETSSLSVIARELQAGLLDLVGDVEVDIVGFSLGGMVASELARRMGERVRKLVLVSSGRGLGVSYVPLEPLVRWRDLPDEARMAAHRKNLDILMIADPAHIDDLAVRLQARNAERSRLRYVRDETGSPLRQCLSEVTCALAGIWGEGDKMIGPHLDQRAEAFRAIQTSSKVAFIPDAGHWVQYEAAAAFNRTLLRMLEGNAR